MKKLALTIAIVLGTAIGLTAQQKSGGGLFERGNVTEEDYNSAYGSSQIDLFGNLRADDLTIELPNHGQDENQNAPLGSGIAVLLGLGGAYLVAKKRREE